MYPFSAVVGQEEAKLALAIAAVDPGIGGVLLSGVKGTGKSTLVRAFPDILPKQEVVDGCRFGCLAAEGSPDCPECRERSDSGTPLPSRTREPRVVNVPLGVTEDRLLGTIDVEKLLREGVEEFQPGLLALANNQVLYIDEVNLLPDNITDDILDVAASGVNTVEREGVSVAHPARFVLVGTMNPEEGRLRPQITDRFAMAVDIETERDPELRLEIVERTLAFEHDRQRFRKAWSRADARLRSTIAAARVRYPEVGLPNAAIEAVAHAMSELEVDGQRPDMVTVRAATAWAALENRDEVDPEALKTVASLCVGHRTRGGGLEQPPTEEELKEVISDAASRAWKADSSTYFNPEETPKELQ